MEKEKIPQSMQIAYNCDYMKWDSTKCCFLCVAEDPKIGSWSTGEISYEEFMYAKTNAEEYEWALYDEYLAELEAEYYETLISLKDYN